MQVDLFIPLKTVSEANQSEHWTKKRKRVSMQQKWVWIELNNLQVNITTPCHIYLTRHGIKLMDSDNLVSSFKHVRDSIADYIHPGLPPGLADNDLSIEWHYQQVKVPTKECGITIRII
jgi:ribosomal protein L28